MFKHLNAIPPVNLYGERVGEFSVRVEMSIIVSIYERLFTLITKFAHYQGDYQELFPHTYTSAFSAASACLNTPHIEYKGRHH